jgi:perosamine synthetase
MVNRRLFCGGPSVGLGAWFGGNAAPSSLDGAWPQLEGRRVFGTVSGRSAIELACRLLGIGPGHEVLVPAYNCGTEVDAILHSGATTTGYRITRGCEIDLSDLQSRKSGRTRAVYVIHYFGWEQPLDELWIWCQANGLLLIEDCALALFSQGATGAIGRMGDVAIYSLPKTLGCQHGGLLSLPESRAVDRPNLRPADSSILVAELKRSARCWLNECLYRLGLSGAVLRLRRRSRATQRPTGHAAVLPDIPYDYYFDRNHHSQRALHPRAQALAASAQWQEITRRRRANYQQLARNLAGIRGVDVLFPELPPDVCPLSLPVVTPQRDRAVQELLARGVAALPWWAGFHRDGIEWARFPDAIWLKQNVLTLPIHHGLIDRQLDYIATCAAEVYTRGDPVSPSQTPSHQAALVKAGTLSRTIADGAHFYESHAQKPTTQPHY